MDLHLRAADRMWPVLRRLMGGHTAVYRATSPMTYMAQEKAPLLVLQGDNDIRVPKGQAEQVVATLKANGRTRPKVFKLRTLTMQPGGKTVLSATVSFASMTTRRPSTSLGSVALGSGHQPSTGSGSGISAK